MAHTVFFTLHVFRGGVTPFFCAVRVVLYIRRGENSPLGGITHLGLQNRIVGITGDVYTTKEKGGAHLYRGESLWYV